MNIFFLSVAVRGWFTELPFKAYIENLAALEYLKVSACFQVNAGWAPRKYTAKAVARNMFTDWSEFLMTMYFCQTFYKILSGNLYYSRTLGILSFKTEVHTKSDV